MRCGLMLVLAAACSGAEGDPAATLARLRAMVLSQAERIPNYTCVQTIDREFFRPSNKKLPWSCDDLAALKAKGHYRLVPASADRFRLEVRVGADDEMYSWVGASRFEDRPLRQLIGYGPTSTGAFGALLLVVFKDAQELRFDGEKKLNGRQTYAYTFRVPVEHSHNNLYLRRGSETAIAYEGTVFADPERGIPIQLRVFAGELPSDANCCRLTTELDYFRARIGGGEFLLPYEARQRFVIEGGTEVENTVTFSGCREFQAKSTVAYGASQETKPATGGDAAVRPSLEAPASLGVTIALAGKIDSARAAGGDPFTGRLSAPVLDASGNVIAPAGALVRGRITLVERSMQPDRVTIRLAAETVEIGGVEVPFRLIGRKAPAAPKTPAGGRGLQSRGIPIGEFPRWVTGNDLVLQCSGKRCVIPDGFRTEWVMSWP